MKPLYERVLIKPREKETTTASGIMLPDKAVKRCCLRRWNST
jgi:co-chaperonin GroES (HSP10)